MLHKLRDSCFFVFLAGKRRQNLEVGQEGNSPPANIDKY